MNKFIIKSCDLGDRNDNMLRDFLKAIPENDWNWRIMQFDGSFKPAEGETRFDTLITDANKNNGFPMSWSLLKEFVGIILEIHNFHLIASVDPDRYVICEDGFYEKYDLTDLKVLLEVFDSYEWALWSQHREIMEQWEVMYNVKDYKQK